MLYSEGINGTNKDKIQKPFSEFDLESKFKTLFMDSFLNLKSKKSFDSEIWLDVSHPNYTRWKRGRDISIHRGEFVLSILKNYSTCKNLKVLDLGGGLGGTSKVFSDSNFLVSYDVDLFRLKNQDKAGQEYYLINGDALKIPFKKNIFDIIILQDVIEHLPENNNLPETLSKMLKDDGVIFMSTPNKFSCLNILSDPHWGMPFVSLLSRGKIKKYFLRYFRKQDLKRKDIAGLFSLNKIKRFFGDKFIILLNTKFAVQKLMEGHKGIIWSGFHLFLLKLILSLKLNKVIVKMSNDNPGFLNKFITPTFYFILKKNILGYEPIIIV